MAIYSYNLKGVKEGFSDWISNISPKDTFIVSNSRKEGTKNNTYKWQSDSLAKVAADLTAVQTIQDILEGENYRDTVLKGTTSHNGVTQIFRKTFKISDTAIASSTWGREGELKLQLEKAGQELKNMMEVIFSSDQAQRLPSATLSARTDGLYTLIADGDNPDSAVTTAGATTVKLGGASDTTAVALDYANFEKVASALFLNGSKACIILTNPINAPKIADIVKDAIAANIRQLQSFKIGEKVAPDVVMDTEDYTITDIRGHQWCVCFSNFCPVNFCYFIHPDDIFQRVLREPKAEQLGKDGSYENWMVSIEAGLCLANPYAAGAIRVKQ